MKGLGALLLIDVVIPVATYYLFRAFDQSQTVALLAATIDDFAVSVNDHCSCLAISRGLRPGADRCGSRLVRHRSASSGNRRTDLLERDRYGHRCRTGHADHEWLDDEGAEGEIVERP